MLGQSLTAPTPVAPKGVITEDRNDCRNNKSACVFGVLPSITPAVRRKTGMKGGGFMEGRQGGDLDAGTGRDTQVTEKGGASLFTYLSFSPPKQWRNARRGERRRRGEDRWL